MYNFFLLLSIIPAFLSAQCFIEVTDTFSCNSGAMLLLDVVTVDALETDAELEVATPKTPDDMLPIEIFMVCPAFAPIWKTLLEYVPSSTFIPLYCVVEAMRSNSVDN